MKRFLFILILFLSNFLSAQKSYKINTVSWIFKAPKNYVAKADNFEKAVKAGEEYLKKEENIESFSTDDVVLLTLEKEDSSPNVIMVSYKNNSSIQDHTLNGYANIVREMLLRNANHDYPDAENYLSVFYSKNPAPPNYTRFKNDVFDKLYEEALSETNDSLRYGLYQEMDKQIVANAPVVPLWYDMAIHLVHKNIKHFEPNSLNMLELRWTKKD